MRSQTKQIMQIVIKAFVGSSVTECAHRVSEKADFTALPLRAGVDIAGETRTGVTGIACDCAKTFPDTKAESMKAESKAERNIDIRINTEDI